MYMARSARRKQQTTTDNEQKAWSFASAANAFMMSVLAVTVMWALFALSSWQLALIRDQLTCVSSRPTGYCWLPTNTAKPPYGTGPVPKRETIIGETEGIIGDFFKVIRDIATILTANILGAPEKQSKKRAVAPQSGGGARRTVQRGGSPSVAKNPLSGIDLDGWRPFDLTVVGWPYSWANSSGWLYLKEWVGTMSVTSWSLSRKALLVYLKSFNSLIEVRNYPGISRLFRFIITLIMPAILALTILLQPIVTILTTLYGSFSTGLGITGLIWACLLALPMTVINVALQSVLLLGYYLVGPFFGTGKAEFGINVSSFREGGQGGYLGILQALTFIMLSIGLFSAVIPFLSADSQK